jgi:hypothetical protein
VANHLHKQIRDALVTALTGLTTTSTRVYANRLQVMADANLPGLRIFLDSEEAQEATIHQPVLEERTLVVECCGKAVTGLDDLLDQISKEVEVALASGISISGKSLQLFYAGMEFTDMQSDRPVGVKRLRFSVPYMAMSNAPDALI